jgi:hypothetical protein
MYLLLGTVGISVCAVCHYWDWDLRAAAAALFWSGTRLYSRLEERAEYYTGGIADKWRAHSGPPEREIEMIGTNDSGRLFIRRWEPVVPGGRRPVSCVTSEADLHELPPPASRRLYGVTIRLAREGRTDRYPVDFGNWDYCREGNVLFTRQFIQRWLEVYYQIGLEDSDAVSVSFMDGDMRPRILDPYQYLIMSEKAPGYKTMDDRFEPSELPSPPGDAAEGSSESPGWLVDLEKSSPEPDTPKDA